ncbi:MAG: hypothetical protein DMG91_17270 [Acidobacteria bacterium]|nr:MAG: hypothetical protein DMG91_17270 [Acidobacteriota bacterium]
MKRPHLLVAIAVLAAVGVAVSSVSLYHHYAASKTTYCEVGESFSCDIVNRSIYSTVLGVPVAAIGIAGYASLLILSILYREKPDTPMWLFTGSLAGLGFALYLTYIEGFRARCFEMRVCCGCGVRPATTMRRTANIDFLCCI